MCETMISSMYDTYMKVDILNHVLVRLETCKFLAIYELDQELLLLLPKHHSKHFQHQSIISRSSITSHLEE